MAQQQQTVLRVETNVQSEEPISGSTIISITSNGNLTNSGSGTTLNPFTGVTTTTGFTDNKSFISYTVSNGNGVFYYSIDIVQNDDGIPYYDNSVQCFIQHANGYSSQMGGFKEYNTYPAGSNVAKLEGEFKVLNGDRITFDFAPAPSTGTTKIVAYVRPDEVTPPPAIKTYDTLDLYGDVPIKLNKSFSELQDISKRNSDYSIGLQIPGSKKNNRFFENYFDVDMDSLFFDVTQRVPCQILINDEIFFSGYLRLNKVNVLDSKVEYDVTLYSTVADLFGKIGNRLLKDLDYNDIDFHFNHYFSLLNVMYNWRFNQLTSTRSVPSLWFYPVLHNGYNYTADTNNDQIVNVSGTTQDTTRLYTSTVASGYTNYAAFTSAGGLEYRVNSPKDPLLNNQLKPALNIWSLLQLMFRSYGYTIKSNFFNTPWFKLLYMYGMYSSDTTKFGYTLDTIEELGYEGIELVLGNTTISGGTSSVNVYVTKKGTGIPVYCTQPITFTLNLFFFGFNFPVGPATIEPMTTGQTINANRPGTFNTLRSSQVAVSRTNYLKYLPTSVGSNIPYIDGDYIDFSLAIDQNLKQIDLLSSISKKFNLLFIPDPDVQNQIIIEPYDYYIGTGDIHNWTDKLSWDKGFQVEPALNYIESELILTDLEDGDDGNKIFKDRNNRVYGENKVYNETDFKSQTKKIDTIFSPEVIRRWDNRVGIPMGINYASQNKPSESGNKQKVTWEYKGIRSKPKLIFNLGNFSPFIDQVGENYSVENVNTTFFRLQKSNRTNFANGVYAFGSLGVPVISHTMPIGNPDSNKNGRGFKNDSLCILFNSEEPADIGLGIPTFNAYTENDMYSAFYTNRINNVFDKNTRFLTGNFNLKLSDIKNLKPNDLIKIKEQYFTVNKINGYNYTSPELTKVELVQANIEPKQYPDRYFFYQYCLGNTTIYKFKTWFNPNENDGVIYLGENDDSIRRTYFFWSVLYDYMVGALGGNVTGYTSSYTIPLGSEVYPYKIWEVTKEDYESSGLLHNYDPNNFYFIDDSSFEPTGFNTEENDYSYVFTNDFFAPEQRFMFNVAPSCAEFATLANETYVNLSPAGTPKPTPTPTPTSTPAPTPTPTAPMIGSLLMTFDELVNDRGVDSYTVVVNGILRDLHFTDTENLYSTNLSLGDDVFIQVNTDPVLNKVINVYRRDYTTDDQGGDLGIRDVFITGVTGTTGTTSFAIFTASTRPDSYNFEYRVSITTGIAPTPTPTATPTPTPTPTPPPCEYWRVYNTVPIPRPYFISNLVCYKVCTPSGGIDTICVAKSGGGSGTVPTGTTFDEFCISGGTGGLITVQSGFAVQQIGPCPTPGPTPTPTATPTATPNVNVTAQYVYNWNGLTDNLNLTGSIKVDSEYYPAVQGLISGSSGIITGSTNIGLFSSNMPDFFRQNNILCEPSGPIQNQITGSYSEIYVNNVLVASGADPDLPGAFEPQYTVPLCPSINETEYLNPSLTLNNGDVIRFVRTQSFSNVIPTGVTFDYVYNWDNAPSPTHSVNLIIGGTGSGEEKLINNVPMLGISGSYTGSTVISGSVLGGNPYATLSACANVSFATASSVTMSIFDNNVLTNSVSASNRRIATCPTTSSLLTVLGSTGFGGGYPWNHTLKYVNDVKFVTVQPYFRHQYSYFNAGALAKTFQLGFDVDGLQDWTYISTSNVATGTITSPNQQYGNYQGANRVIKVRIGVCKNSGTLTRDDIAVTLRRNGTNVQTLTDAVDVSIKTCGGTPFFTIKEYTFSPIDLYSGDQILFVWTDNFK